MKKINLFILLLTSSFLFSQKVDTVSLIMPIVEGPSISSRSLNAYKVFNQYKNWGINKLGLDTVMNEYTGKGTTICICDTGEPEHKDLQKAIGVSANFTNDKSVKDKGSGHSTHVAGIVHEIAPDARLIFAKVLNDSGTGSSIGVSAGIEWCREKGADIINLSLGSPGESSLIKEAIFKAILDSMIVVAAAGNAGHKEGEDRMGYPAKWPEVVAVGSIDEKITPSVFTSSGTNGDVVAPGGRILSTYLNNQYQILSGTSMAAPFVSGISALWIEKTGRRNGFEPLIEMGAFDMVPRGFDWVTFHGHTTPRMFFEKPVIPDPEPEPEPKKGIAWYWWALGGLLLGGFLLLGFITKWRFKFY